MRNKRGKVENGGNVGIGNLNVSVRIFNEMQVENLSAFSNQI